MALCAVGAASFMMRDGLGTAPTILLVLSIGVQIVWSGLRELIRGL